MAIVDWLLRVLANSSFTYRLLIVPVWVEIFTPAIVLVDRMLLLLISTVDTAGKMAQSPREDKLAVVAIGIPLRSNSVGLAVMPWPSTKIS